MRDSANVGTVSCNESVVQVTHDSPVRFRKYSSVCIQLVIADFRVSVSTSKKVCRIELLKTLVIFEETGLIGSYLTGLCEPGH